MSTKEFEKVAIKHMKAIVDAYQKLGDDDYLNLCWINGRLMVHNCDPKNDVPTLYISVPYPNK